MRIQSSRLPSRFPVGTKFVIEGRGEVFSRYVELPDGTHFDLPTRAKRTGKTMAAEVRRQHRRSRVLKRTRN
ncbi:MAG TPA: hypothetical protein VFB45_12540 [Pseudolabrys sp.]|nr:hypothetical protein [Pseudolabrys sp.]